jgi:hypothetical protein
MRTAILIHGHFLPLPIWGKVMWGKPKEGLFGAIPKGIQLSEKEHADFIFWCSGIPVQGGRAISPNALEFAIARGKELLECESMVGLDISKLVQKSLLDDAVPNTREEIARAAVEFKKRNIERVFLVSPPKHIFRAHQEALIHRAAGHLNNIEIFAIASDVDFPDAPVADVAIIEPPHRRDQPLWQTHKYARAVIDILQRNDAVVSEDFLRKWGAVLQKYDVEVLWEPRK